METSPSPTPERIEPSHAAATPPQARPPSLSLRPMYTVLTLIVGVICGVGGLFAYQEYTRAPLVTSYEECIQAKNSTIQESYPATCVTKDGKRFTQPIEPTDTNPIYFDPQSCNTDDDCAVAIQSEGCCMCPKAVNKDEIGKDGWVEYETYTKQQKPSTCQTFAACAPCDKPSTPICQNNMCTFPNAKATPKPDTGYTCPDTEWVDCMPTISDGNTSSIRIQCTQEFLSWAKENCPNFQGAAL